ncbi:MAG: hypothetical protein ACE5GJ_12500 [Gemmatimonadota bacterium]
MTLTSCVYYNAIYNAERRWSRAEALRLAGQDSAAAVAYDDVIRKAAAGFRREPDGPWADDALLLLGRAYLRRGELYEARAALERVVERSDDPRVRLAARVYLGAVAVVLGEPSRGVEILNGALRGLSPGPLLAEGHLWRGRALLSKGSHDTGWWDLDRAAANDARLAVAAALERLRWGVAYGDSVRVREGLHRLLLLPVRSARVKGVEEVLEEAAKRWGPGPTADLMAGATGSGDVAWAPEEWGSLSLQRARFLHEAGREEEAREQAMAVAAGIGRAAARARLMVARWDLARARDLTALQSVSAFLAPVAGDSVVMDLADAVARTARLAEAGLSNPLAWFAAAEAARDGLGAPLLARGFFIAYADAAPREPWAAKALLAALELSEVPEDRSWLRRRLEEYARNPYVLAARGWPAPGFQDLEEELARRLQALASPPRNP